MAETPPAEDEAPRSDADSGEDAAPESRHQLTTGTPSWVKVFGVVALVLVLVLVIGLITGLAGPGGHGPSRHAPSGEADTPSSGATEGHTPPPGIPDHGAQQP